MGSFFKSSHRLMQEGVDLVEDEEYEAALKIATTLRRRRFTGCFELEALVHRGRGELEKALAVLQEGVRVAPSVFLNQLLLGSTLSDLERYEDALAAYDRAAACPEVMPGFLPYNRALVYRRQGKFELALRELPWKPSNPELTDRVLAVRAGLLCDLEHWTELEPLARELPESGEARYLLARALHGLGRQEEALAAVLESVRIHPAGKGRQLLTELCPDGPFRHWRLLYRGPTFWKGRRQTFVRCAQVVAESVEAAFALVTEEEAEEIRGDLRLGDEPDDTLEMGPAPEELRGVLHLTPYIVAGD